MYMDHSFIRGAKWIAPRKVCPHDNISVNQVWDKGECIKSEVVCDDCKEVIKTS